MKPQTAFAIYMRSGVWLRLLSPPAASSQRHFSVILSSWWSNEAPINRDFVSPSENLISGVGIKVLPLDAADAFVLFLPTPRILLPINRDLNDNFIVNHVGTGIARPPGTVT